MPSIDGMDLMKSTASAILFMQSGTLTVDMYSGMMSSPWSTQKFTKTQEDANTAKYYVSHSIIASLAFAAMAGYLAKSLWPLVGWAVLNVYMIFLYKNSMKNVTSPPQS